MRELFREKHHGLIKRLAQGSAFFLILCIPTLSFAQSELKSSNYALDDINFGTNFTLTTGQSTVPPEISSEGPTIVELTPTTVKIFWKTDKKSSSTIMYGQTTDYGQETGNSTLVTEHTVTLFGLQPETAYNYKAKSVDAFGSSSETTNKTFTTPAEAGINSIKVTDVGYDRALISWTTGLFTASKLEYGTTTKYGSTKETSSRSFLTNHTIQLTELLPGTDYHFRIVAEGEDGAVTRSSDLIFSTIANPIFDSMTTENVSSNETLIKWRTNVFTTGIITYKSAKDTKELSAGDTTLQRDHTVTLQNLYGLTDYTFKVLATDSQGKQVVSAEQKFTTLNDVTPPEIKDFKVSVTRSGEELVLTATWKTNEPTKSKVFYNPKTNAELVTELPESSAYLTEHVVVSSGLIPSTPYSLKSLSSDFFGNQAEETINFVTPGIRKSIFQLILDNILNQLGWVSKVFERN